MRNLITAWGILRLVYGHLALLHAGKSNFCHVYVMWESKGGVVIRALASHQCGPGSNPHVDAICGWVCWWFSPLLLVLRFFSLLKKTTFPKSIHCFIYLCSNKVVFIEKSAIKRKPIFSTGRENWWVASLKFPHCNSATNDEHLNDMTVRCSVTALEVSLAWLYPHCCVYRLLVAKRSVAGVKQQLETSCSSNKQFFPSLEVHSYESLFSTLHAYSWTKPTIKVKPLDVYN